MNYHKRLLLVAGLLVAVTSTAEERYFSPRIDEARWQVSASPLECVLSQEIPRYGTASFVQKAGKDMIFQIEVKRTPLQVDYARLSSMPPNWRYDTEIRDFGRVTMVKSRTPITVDTVRAHRLLNELQAGMFPTLRHEDWFDGRDNILVSVSSVNIEPTIDEFIQCLAEVLPHSLEDVAETTFFYQFAEEKMTEDQKARLEQIADYVTVDEDIRGIELNSYTDNIGYRRKNHDLSQRRAESIRDFLVDRGVDPDIFVIQAHGERAPKYDNDTEEGRAKNRRVTIQVSRDPVEVAEPGDSVMAESESDSEEPSAAGT